MVCETVEALELETGALSIELNCKGLYAFIHEKDKTRVAIAGDKGIVILTRQQARALAEELIPIVEMYLS